jgi:hypothetical protein
MFTLPGYFEQLLRERTYLNNDTPLAASHLRRRGVKPVPPTQILVTYATMRRMMLGVLVGAFGAACSDGPSEPSAPVTLTAPVWRTPADCTRIPPEPPGTSPTQLVWSWEPVPGAAGYRFLRDSMDACAAGRWCSDVHTPILIPVPTPPTHVPNRAEMIFPLPQACGVFQPASECSGTTYLAGPPGTQPLRAQVWAVDSAGNEGPRSSFRRVTYDSYERLRPGQSGC